MAHTGDAPWLLAHGPFDRAAFGLDADDEVPDLSVDPDTLTLSVNNTSATVLSYFITVEHPVLIRRVPDEAETSDHAVGKAVEDLVRGDLVQAQHNPVTFVLVLQPQTTADVCRIVLEGALGEGGAAEGDACEEASGELRITSDIKEVEPIISSDVFDPSHTYQFPLGPGGPYLCSQGAGGEFTHFYPGTYHAVDFECPVGTSVLAVGDGTILEVQQENTVTGCHVSNLFRWNSVMLCLNDGVHVEYVHIRPNSCLLKVGDTVRAGDKLCETGDVGFCPTPHLHLQMHKSAAKNAPTIPFALRDAQGKAVIPVAGEWYG